MQKIVQAADHRGPAGTIVPMKEDYGQSMLSLCVSDRNKELLLSCEGFILVLVDSLLLDPAHPRIENVTLGGKTDWEATKGPVQRVSYSSPTGASHA
jgi:hypothetical protein